MVGVGRRNKRPEDMVGVGRRNKRPEDVVGVGCNRAKESTEKRIEEII